MKLGKGGGDCVEHWGKETKRNWGKGGEIVWSIGVKKQRDLWNSVLDSDNRIIMCSFLTTFLLVNKCNRSYFHATFGLLLAP